MDVPERERRAAREALGLSAPGDPPADRAQVAKMEATIAALQQWRQAIDDEPPPELPQAPPRSGMPPPPVDWRWWAGGLAIAASLVVAVGLWTLIQLGEMAPQVAHAPPAEQAVPDELMPEAAAEALPSEGDTVGAVPGEIPAPTTMAPPITSASPGTRLDVSWLAEAPAWAGGKGGRDGAEGGLGGAGGPPGGQGGTPKDPGSKPGEADGGFGGAKNLQVEEPAPLNQLPFKCRVPQQLPGGWKLDATRSVGDRLQVRYTRAGKTLVVSIWSTPNLQLDPHEATIARRRPRALARDGLGFAFEGPITLEQAGALAEKFIVRGN